MRRLDTLRRRACRSPLAAREFRDQAARRLIPALALTRATDEARLAAVRWLGLDGRDRPDLAGLDRRTRRLAQVTLWSILDPEARRDAPTGYFEPSVDPR